MSTRTTKFAGSEIRFDDRGRVSFRGVRERWELYATSN